MKYEELSSKPDFSEIQPATLGFWMENKVFEGQRETIICVYVCVRVLFVVVVVCFSDSTI